MQFAQVIKQVQLRRWDIRLRQQGMGLAAVVGLVIKEVAQQYGNLIGLIFAIRPEPTDRAELVAAGERDERRTVWGGFVSFLAVGCPVCNQAVVALVGTSGALSWWAPVQPVVGLLAVGLLVYTLRKRLDTYQLAACPIPA